jgi:hypothetical protein
MVHGFQDDRILRELMYKGCGLRVEYEILCGAAPVSDTVAEPGIVIGGDAAVNYMVAIRLRES